VTPRTEWLGSVVRGALDHLRSDSTGILNIGSTGVTSIRLVKEFLGRLR